MSNQGMNWAEDRIKRLARPESVAADVYIRTPVWAQLSADEQIRVRSQLDLVEKMAQRLAANMLKGVLKYPEPPTTPAEWLEYLKDDAADTLNYVWLLGEAMQHASLSGR